MTCIWTRAVRSTDTSAPSSGAVLHRINRGLVPAKPPSPPELRSTSVSKGCPFDCGLCPEHRQHSCCVVLEVTERCNLSCPVCFAESRTQATDPEIATIESWFKLLLSAGGPYNIQLSGGEPTLRDDLPEIIHARTFAGLQLFSTEYEWPAACLRHRLRAEIESGWTRLRVPAV